MIGGNIMKSKRNIILKLSLFIFFLFFGFHTVKADGIATTGFSGNSSVYVGNNIEVILYVGSVNGTTGGLAAFGGTISYSTDKLELVSTSSLAPFSVELNGNKLGGFGQSTITGKSNIMKFIFKTKGVGNATISYSGSSQPDLSANPVSISGCSKTISITNPPSSNNNLSSLSVSQGNINFNKNNTSYNFTVSSSVTSINISATSEDSGATVSGTGKKSLSYGTNRFYIVVTAPNGSKKTYTITVTRKDNRSSNNNLSSLSVNGGDLNPSFNKKTTNYTLDVPYSISNLSVTAKAEDSKSKVTVSGNNNLIAEETNTVTITVTAENGSSKKYTIQVTRGKDPNKVLSNNNYLTKLAPSIGILSPVFDKEKSEYEIWLPYEVDKITFDYQVEDTKYATTKLEGSDTLEAGVNNVCKIIVTAENREERTYTINVKRAKNPSDNSSNNTYIKSIKIKNGKLNVEFNKKTYEYYYTKEKGFKITEVIPEDENSVVSIVEHESTIYLIVSSPSGEYGVYTLREEQIDNKRFTIYFILFVVGLILGYVIRMIIKNKKNQNNKNKTKEMINEDVKKNTKDSLKNKKNNLDINKNI